MKKIYTLLLTLMISCLGFAQTLSAGDIVLIEFSFDNPDSFTFLALKDIPNGEEIKFTDNGWKADNTFRANEGILTWTSTGVSCGDVITISTVSPMALSGSGDQILAYQGDNSSPTFITALNSEGSGWQADATSASTSAIPSGLDATNSIAFAEVDNGIYTGILSGTIADIRSAINTPTNWTTSNSVDSTFTDSFTLSDCAAPSMDTLVTFIGDSATIGEDEGTFELEFTIANEDATNATSFDVVLTSGDPVDIDNYTTQTVIFPAGSVADETIELTITDDGTFEADETLTFEIQNVTGGTNASAGSNNTFELTITNNDVPPVESLPYNEDFADCNAAQWLPFDESGGNSWSCAGGEYNMNGFPNPDDLDWLISSFSINFDAQGNETISVETSERFGNTINEAGEFELRYSTDYAGFGDPTSATWTPLIFNPNNTSTNATASAPSTTFVDASGITGTAYLAFVYDTASGAGTEDWRISDISIFEGAPDTSVEFIGTSASLAEDAGSIDLEFTITNEDATNATTFDVVLIVGDVADVDSYTTQLVTFPAGVIADQTVTVTITDDILEEADETLTFEIQNITGGNNAFAGPNNSFDLTILANDEPVIPGLLYDADFTNDGDGFPAHNSGAPPAAGPASVGPFGTAPNAWSLSYNTTPGTDGSDNIFEVAGGELTSDDWGGQGIFTSQLIDVTGLSVVDITATGVSAGSAQNTGSEYFRYFYIIDSGSRVETEVTVSSSGDPVNYSVLSLNVSGATSLEVGFEFFENGGGSGYDISDFFVVEGSTNTSVQFATTSDSVFEDAGTYDLTFEILFEDAINDTTFDVVLTSGDAADVDGYTTQTVTFPAGTSANQTVTVTITDDMVEESSEVFTFEIQNVAGGTSAAVGINNSFDLTIQDNDGDVALPGDIVISEIMYNSSGTDDEWIEIYNASGADITLDADWRLNYQSTTYDFTGTLITAGSYLTIAVGSNGDGIFNNDNPFTPDISEIGTPAATINDNNNLGNTSATIELIFDPSGANTTIDIVTYDDGAPNWPSAADGIGPSLELIDLTFDNNLGASWAASSFYDGGTPGAAYVAPVVYTYNGSWSPSDPNGTATASDDIVIASGDATISSNTTCNSVTVNPGAGLTVVTGITLTASNGMTLESSSTSYSSLILDGLVTGTLRYERHVNINGTGSTGSNDLVSAPLTGQAFNTFASINSNILNNGTLFLFGPFEKVTGQYVNWAATETSTLDAGVGYRTGTTDNSSVTFFGAAENGIITHDIVNAGSNNEEWNLVGNPYPSYLNVQDFLNHDVGGVTNLQLFDAPTAAIYGYDGSALNGWTVYNLATTTGSTVIAPGQGFFVSADATNVGPYDLEFTPAMRSTGSSDDFIVGRNAELKYVKLSASTDNEVFGTDIYFNANASLGFDLGYDAALWGDTTPDFALYSSLVQDNSGRAMALQAVNSTDLSDVVIPLGVNANQGEQLTFSIAEMNLPANVSVYLEDNVENTVTLLNDSDYVITPTTALSGTGRFFLRTSEDALSTIDNSLDMLDIFSLNTSKELVINGQLSDDITMLNLYDIQGRLVLTTKLDNTSLQNRIDVSNINTGVYMVTINNNSQEKTKKVIID